MAKNIVICCDGTNNQFGICNTNVVRIAQLVDGDPTRQLCYYDPGVGTLPEQGWTTRVRRTQARRRGFIERAAERGEGAAGCQCFRSKA